MNRAEHAKSTYWPSLERELLIHDIRPDSIYIYLRCFKWEEIIEVWVSQGSTFRYKHLKSYSFCVSSGKLGPKRKEGDKQIPEGLYVVDRYNPQSKFYLSMGLNYPNHSDLVFADKDQPGSDIFIHGECSSTGCIAIGNEAVSELYTLSTISFSQHHISRVDIFPFKYDAAQRGNSYEMFPAHTQFWDTLAPFYSYFEDNHMLPSFSIDSTGYYQIIDNKL